MLFEYFVIKVRVIFRSNWAHTFDQKRINSVRALQITNQIGSVLSIFIRVCFDQLTHKPSTSFERHLILSRSIKIAEHLVSEALLGHLCYLLFVLLNHSINKLVEEVLEVVLHNLWCYTSMLQELSDRRFVSLGWER